MSLSRIAFRSPPMLRKNRVNFRVAEHKDAASKGVFLASGNSHNNHSESNFVILARLQ